MLSRELTARDDRLVESFYRGIYIDAFATQREPLSAWRSALRGERPYRMHVRVVEQAERIVAGITYELYPESQCGFVTYMVVAPDARNRGIGRELLGTAVSALYAEGARAVFGEVNDPRVHGAAARPRLDRFVRWGARVIDVPYIQPALGEGTERDRALCLIVFPPVPAVTGSIVRSFVAELFAATEGRAPDAEVAALLAGIPESVQLRSTI